MGKVSDGRRVGRKIGFPTANLRPDEYLIMPSNGVYLTKTLCGGTYYNSLTNVGINPTFGESLNVSVETHIPGFGKDIYGNDLEVFFLRKLRGEKKFKSADELSSQISLDIKAAMEYFGMPDL
jgi:riboflavin kinase/FMN adenylyltransferase